MRKNILSLDLGRKTLGISISRSGILITPLENFRFNLDDYSKATNRVLEIMEIEKVELIILGLPMFPSGDDCEMTPIIRKFKEDLFISIKNKFKKEIEIIFQDERNSTLEASNILHSNNKNSKQQKKNIDCVASYVILERYLRSIGQID